MCRKVKFINLSLGAIGIYSKSQDTSDLLSDLEVDKVHWSYLLSKISNVCIRTTYYLFCLRDKDWTDPSLLSWLSHFRYLNPNRIQFNIFSHQLRTNLPSSPSFTISRPTLVQLFTLLLWSILLSCANIPWQSSSLCL